MKKIIFIFLIASCLSLNDGDSLTLNVTKFDNLEQKEFTEENGAFCVNTSIIQQNSSFYLTLESVGGEGSINNIIYYKSVDNCPKTFDFSKNDGSLKKIESKSPKTDKYFVYQFEIPKADNKNWYLVIYTGFKGKSFKANFIPISVVVVLIIILVIAVVVTAIGIVLCCCCCPCCRRGGKGTINNEAFPEGETNNLVGND